MMSECPTFSIIIPTYKRPFELVRCLGAITKLDYPADKFEVIVVDDGGKLPDDLLLPFGDKLRLTLLHQENSGPAAARNHGARMAHNDFLVFTDDDCEPDSNWLKTLAAQFMLSPKHLLGGQTVNALETNIYSSASQMLIDYLYDYFIYVDTNNAFFTSNNFALARTEFLALGGFDESFPFAGGEDRDICSRWQASNRNRLFLKTAVVRHFHDLNLKDFWRQHFAYGRGAYYFHAQRAGYLKQTMKIEPFSFYLKMFFYPFRQTSIWNATLILTLFFIAQFANALGFCRELIAISNDN